MEEKVQELVNILKEEKRQLVLHFFPGEKPEDDLGGIQWGLALNEVFGEKFNSYTREERVKALQEFASYVIELALGE